MQSGTTSFVAGRSQFRFRVATVVACAAALLAVAAPQPAPAEPGFPNKPVRILVPYGPGGVGDLTMRLLSQKLSEHTKKQFVIDNRPGAGGVLAAKAVLSSPADGYTLAVTGNGMAISMSLFKSRPYHALVDFTSISITAAFEMLLAVNADSPFKTLHDVVAGARQSPGKLNLGAINPGSTQNLSAHLFKQLTGIDAAIVTYKTTPDLITAILRGDVDLGFDFLAAYQGAIDGKQIRIIATSGEQRNPLLEHVPTARESGFPDYIVTSWNALSAPAGLPDDVLKILNQQVNVALADPDLQEKARKLGMDARGSTPEAMRARMARDIDKWAAVIEKAGIPKQ